MAKSALKRAAPAMAAAGSKKAKHPSTTNGTASRLEQVGSDLDEEEDGSSEQEYGILDQGLRAGRGNFASSDDEDEDAEEDEEDMSDEDSEVNEFDLDASDGENGFDDGEDLLANVDDAAEDSEDELDDEQEEEEEDGDEAAVQPALVLKKSNVRNSKGVAPLKPAELRALAFAELTASPISTLIATQVTSYLAPLTPPTPATSPLHPLLKALHAHLTSLPDVAPVSIEGLRKKGRILPGDKRAKWDKVDLAWTKPRPEHVRIHGSWAWGGASKSTASGEYFVEMAVGIPSILLQAKDYLSPRFLVKSTHYLSNLASNLPLSLGPVSLSYVALPGSQGWLLEIRSAHTGSQEKVGLSRIKGAVIRLRCAWGGVSDDVGADVLAASKMGPLKNLVRPAAAADDSISPADFPATPIHASSLLLSSLPIITHHLKHFHSLSMAHPSFASTVRLLQAWASHRSLGGSLGLTNDFWAWCVARTLDWGAGASSSSSGGGGEVWAGWRKTVEWLAGVDWLEGIWFRVDGDGAYAKDDFRTAFVGAPIFVDPSGKVNLAAGIDIAALEMLKQDAKTTIALLLSQADDEQKFHGCFQKDLTEVVRWDNYAKISIPASLLAPSTHADALDHATPLAYLLSSMSKSLRRALGSRARAFLLSTPPPSRISATDKVKSTKSPEPVIISLGILLHAGEAGRLVDQGPTAEDEAGCAEFQSFWGAKSELRRFKDGAILESVVWETPSQGGLGQQRNKVVSQVVSYILESRHGLTSDNVHVFAGAMDHLIVEPEGLRRAIYLEDSVASSKGFGNIMSAYDSLVKELTGLSDLPLAISSVAPSSSGLRYSTIFTPSPRRLKEFERFPASTQFIEVHDVILTMESSGRWPDDLEGVQKIKAAFLARIAEGLSALHAIVSAQVVFDLAARPIDDNVALEILTSSGYAFRARIHYERSFLLLRSRASKLGLISSEDPSMIHYEERFVHAPRHHAAISTLQHSFTSYSPTIRLVQRWFSSHLLSNHFDPQTIELLVASVFLDASSHCEPPSSGATGFARTMEKLGEWKWREGPLAVPLYTFSIARTSGRRADFPSAKATQGRVAFEKRRVEGEEGGAWRIATEDDVEGRVWGARIDKVIAGRVKGLAKATLKTMNEGVLNGTLVVEQLFTPPMSAYSFILHLDASLIPRYYQSLTPDPAAFVKSKSRSILAGSFMGANGTEGEYGPRLDYDPIKGLMDDLERLYPSTYLLFYSNHGSSTIGGIWNPSAEAVRPWKVNLGFPCRPIASAKGEKEGKAKVVLDKKVVLRDMERMGKGIIIRVESLQ